MAKCECAPLEQWTDLESRQGNDQDQGNDDQGKSKKPILRQLLISSAVWSQYFQFGMCVGTPTVVIPRMRAEHGQDHISPEMASWMSSLVFYASTPWVPVVGLVAWRWGRRRAFALGVAAALLGFALMAAAQGHSPALLLAGLAVQGSGGALQVLMVILLAEYSCPERRGALLAAKSATAYWGIWVANAIGTVAHWHYIAWLGLACGVYSAMTLLFWPESPYWLAAQGRMELCARAHYQLKGRDASSQKELRELIRGRQNCECSEKAQEEPRVSSWTRIWREVSSKSFYKPLLLCTVLLGQCQLSGKLVCSVYAIDIIRELSGSEREAYRGMLVLDGVTVLGMYCGCALSRLLRRRTLLLAGGALAGGLLLAMAVQLRLVKAHLLADNKYLTLALLVGFSLAISCGPVVLSTSITGELLPLRMRCTASAIALLTSNLLTGTGIKVAPFIFTTFGMDGAFLFYGVTSSLLLVVLYWWLPETKDKTLKEIEDMFQ